MTRRLLTLFAVIATLLVAMTALAVPSWAATNPVFTVPTGLVTRMGMPLDFTGASVTSPQGEDLAIFITADHGEVVPQGASTPMCPAPPAVPTPGQLCFFTDPADVGPLNFRGTESQVNNVLSGLTYIPNPGFPSPGAGTLNDTLKFSATEQDIAVGLSSGLIPTDVRVEPDNEAPVFAAIPDVLTGEQTDVNQAYDFINDIEVDDPDQYPCDSVTPDERTSTVTASGGGTLATDYVSAGFTALGNGTPTVVLTGSLTDINNAYDNLTYTPLPNTSYTDLITVFFDDGGCAGFGGHLTTTGSFPLEVVPGPATHFDVVAPPLADNGSPTAVTVTARDADGAVANGYAGMVELTSSDGAAVLPPDAPLVAGIGILPVVLNTDGNQTVTATDTLDGSITGQSNTILVSTPQPVTHFLVDAPASAMAGSQFDFTVTAQDANNMTVTDYAGTVHVTASSSGSLPADATLTNGVGTFSATFTTATDVTITATDTADAAIDGSDVVTIDPAAADHLDVAAPATAQNGTGFTVVVTARDAYGNTDPAYAGTVAISSTDGAADLPADASLTTGVGTFAVTLNTDGMQTVTATDTVTASIDGTSGTIDVSSMPPAAATSFEVAAPATATAGVPFLVTVTAKDAGNATASAYSGTVTITTDDNLAQLPADASLTNGVGTFTVELRAGGSTTITATDTVTASITGTDDVLVSAGPAQVLSVTGPANATVGTPINITVNAIDAFDNLAVGYAGTVQFSSTDGAAALPADALLVGGTAIVPVTLNGAGAHTITATDSVTATITGTTGPITVSAVPPAPATHLGVSAPAGAVAGTPFNVTVTALDATDQTASAYSGTVLLTSTDGGAVLPAATTLTNGVGILTVTLATAGDQTITATDTVDAAISGTSAPIAVTDPNALPEPAASVDQSSVEVGGTLLVEGSGFLPGEQVQVWLHSDPILLATVVADQAGAVSYLAMIPGDTPAGTHHIELLGLTSAVRVATADFTVTAAAVPTATTTVPGPTPTTLPTAAGTFGAVAGSAGSASSAGSSGTTATAGSLPVTGIAITGLVAAGLALLTAGLVVLAGARRRSR